MPALKLSPVAFALILVANGWVTDAHGQPGPPVDRRSTASETDLPGMSHQLTHALEWVEVERMQPIRQAQFAETVREEIVASNCAALPGNCDCCPPTFWTRFDYLYWYLDGASVPPLVTTSPVGTDREDAGVLGLATTSILFGNQVQGDQGRSGARIEFGRWFHSRGGLGIHLAFFGVERTKDRAFFDTSGVPILARPFFSVEPTAVGSNSELVSFPGELEGNIRVDNRSSFDGGELMLRWLLTDQCDRRLQFVSGYQYVRLDDDLGVADFKRVIGTSSGLAVGTTLAETDIFQTRNQFDGFALGVLASTRSGRSSLDVGLQLALGNTNSRVRIDGVTRTTVPLPGGGTDVATTRGGLLALPSNIGVYEKDSFAVVPQLNIDYGYELYPRLRALFGYRFLYWSQVARAADQIDGAVNLSQLDPGGVNGDPRPQFDFLLADFWAQGINIGLDYRF